MNVRLSVDDYSMLGVFSNERATQTEDTEIVPINKISDDIQHLVKVLLCQFLMYSMGEVSLVICLVCL